MAQTIKTGRKQPAGLSRPIRRASALSKRLSAAESRIARLEAILEDRLDIDASDRAEREARERGEKPIPWDVARRGLG